MKKGMKMEIMKAVIGVLIMSMVIALLPVMNLKAKDTDFSADLQIGFGNTAEVGKYVPFYVTVENKTKDFDGNIQMIIPVGSNENYMYEQKVSIPAGAKKTVDFVLPMYSTYGKIRIRLANDKGKVIWYTDKRFTVGTKITDVNVGILSDDFAALGYMDRLPFTGNNQFVTRIFEMDINSFSSDWHALDMLDVIVISDFSTDLFTDGQIRALTMWVNNGGLLMVGTGSTSSKTLSGLNNKLFEVTPGKLETKETKLGLSLRGFSYSYSNNNNYNNYYYDPYNDPDFLEQFEEAFEEYKEEYENEFRTEFENDWWGEEIDDETWEEDWLQEYFKNFCMEKTYPAYIESLQNPGGNTIDEVNQGSSISVSVLQMTADKEDDVIVGDDLYGGVYDLHHIFHVGEGFVVVSGIDYTKNPIPGCDYAPLFFLDLVESLIGQKVQAEFDNTQYGYTSGNGFSWKEKEYLKNVSDAPIPPGILYIGLLLFFQGILVALYFILRHKKKSFKLWFWYPVIAIGGTLLVFCLGFSTRLMTPRLKVDSIIQVGENILTETGYAAFTVPRNKKYSLSIASRYQVKQEVPNNYYSYSSNNINDLDMDSYTRSFNVSSNFFELQIRDIEPLGTEGLILDTIDYTDKNIIIEMNGNDISGTVDAGDISITNKMGVDLEDVVVMVCGAQIKSFGLGKLKQGETRTLTQCTEETEVSFYLNSSEVVNLSQSDMKAIPGLLIGSISPSYRKYRNRARILNHAVNEYKYSGTANEIIVYAFPKSGFDESVQESRSNQNAQGFLGRFGSIFSREDTKYKEERTVLLVKRMESLYSYNY